MKNKITKNKILAEIANKTNIEPDKIKRIFRFIYDSKMNDQQIILLIIQIAGFLTVVEDIKNNNILEEQKRLVEKLRATWHG